MTTPLPEFDLAGFTPYRLAVAAEKTSEALARQYRERFGISIPEWRWSSLYQPKNSALCIRDASIVSNRSGNPGRYFIVLN